MEEIILFGGRSCKTTINEYLSSKIQEIAIQIEDGLRANKTEEEIKKEILKTFTMEKCSINLSDAEITDIGANHYETRLKQGRKIKVLINHYYYSIPFKGDSSLIKYRPLIFHGHNCKAEIITKENSNEIRTFFTSEENSQEQFNYNKHQSIGDLSLNIREANKDIAKWNENIEQEIDRVYIFVKNKYERTIEFNRKNNIS